MAEENTKEIKETAEEKKERKLLERDTRNILLGSVTSMISSVTTLYIVNKYFIQKAASAAVAEYARKTQYGTMNPLVQPTNIWIPLSNDELNKIRYLTNNQYIK